MPYIRDLTICLEVIDSLVTGERWTEGVVCNGTVITFRDMIRVKSGVFMAPLTTSKFDYHGWNKISKSNANSFSKNENLVIWYDVMNDLMQVSLQWRHNECDDISNHQPYHCLLNRLFKAQIKENIKAPRHWPLWGEFTGDRWIPLSRGQ